MNAKEMLDLADELNSNLFDKADADLDHVEIEILECAKMGNYSLEYEFLPEYDPKKIIYIVRNLEEKGFNVEVIEKESFVLNIDWSRS